MRWTVGALPSTVAITECPRALKDPKFAAAYPALEQLRDQAGEQSLTAKGNAYPVVAMVDGGNTRAILLPLDRFFDIRVKHALRLWRSLSNISPGPNPAALPQQRQNRLIAALRAFDGRQKGASYRDIADTMFAAGAISASGWKTHHLRDRAIRTVKLGTDLVQGGYPQLLLHPYRRRISQSLWRGGDLATA